VVENGKRVEIHPDGWYSINAVASHWKIGRDTVTRRIEQGIIKAFELPAKPSRKRVKRIRRIKGSEILRVERTA
jgi:transposase